MALLALILAVFPSYTLSFQSNSSPRNRPYQVRAPQLLCHGQPLYGPFTLKHSVFSWKQHQTQSHASKSTSVFTKNNNKGKTNNYGSKSWLPPKEELDDDIFATDDERDALEYLSIEYLANIIQSKLAKQKAAPATSATTAINDSPSQERNKQEQGSDNSSTFQEICESIVGGNFLDMTCTKQGEEMLEQLFYTAASPSEILGQENVGTHDAFFIIKGAVIAMQSLLIMGMQVGVKGTPTQLQQIVSHLEPIVKKSNNTVRSNFWKKDEPYDWRAFSEYVQQLKYERDGTAGTQLLARLLKRRNFQGAFDLLVALGIWGKHEDLALLRSGFPTRFTDEEELAAIEAEQSTKDVDALLGLRQDLRHLKVYTVDAESTSEIDDGKFE